MRRALTIAVVVVQVLALGWLTTGDNLPGAPRALGRLPHAPRTPSAAQPREIRVCTACSEPTQYGPRPRTAAARTPLAALHAVQALGSPVPAHRPQRRPPPPLILRI